ncbi:MAG: rhomboid family intramembrane serine protease [Desulfatiglandaceae bacterium]
MIPIRDTIQSKNYPVINNIIIGVNILVYFIQMAQGENLNRFIVTYGLVPARYSISQIAAYFTFGQQAFAFFSFMFLHGGLLHLLGNMWSLYIFGDNVEDRLGPLRYLLFYLLCGFLSGISHLLINWHSQVPTIGASGAIAGIMGAYFLLYPGSKILTLIPIFFIPYFVQIPAFLFLGFWFFLQFISAAGSSVQAGGVAWWAHIGGFVFGMVLLKLFLRLPEFGVTRRMRRVTSKNKTHRLQPIKVTGSADDPHLYGSIVITPKEAQLGTRKLVNVPWGVQKRLFYVTVPPGVQEATMLRLGGMGKRFDHNKRGDLYLRVVIE